MPELTKTRPKYLNLQQIRLPLPGIVSILHRISGAGLFLMLPLILWLFASSLGTPESFAAFKAVVGNPLMKLFLLLLVAGYLYHFCAGIRFLLLDLHVGIEKEAANKSAGMVLGVSLPLTAILIWGVLL